MKLTIKSEILDGFSMIFLPENAKSFDLYVCEGKLDASATIAIQKRNS